MEIETLEVAGIGPAIASARLSYDSESAGIDRDIDLLSGLAKRSDSEGKALRMIQVWAAVRAPRYWWVQFDTYRVGVEKGSQSTMHTILKRPLNVSDFADGVDDDIIQIINGHIELKRLDRVKKNLPEGFLQRRVVMLSYTALRHIYRDGLSHRLPEWQEFCAWAAGLPYASELIVGGAL